MTLQELGIIVGMVTGVGGFLISIRAIHLNAQTRRDYVNSRKPIIQIFELPAAQQPRDFPAWTAARLLLRSRSNMGYSVIDIAVIWPPSARLARMVASGREPDGSAIYAPTPAARRIPSRLKVAHAGQVVQRGQFGAVQGTGDEHHEDLLFSASSSSSAMTFLNRWRARSVSSQSAYASFIVRLRDQNEKLTLHTRMVTLKIRTISPKSGAIDASHDQNA